MTTTLADVQTQVHEMAQNHRDYLVRTDDIHFVNLEQVVINGELHPVMPHAQRFISNRLCIPYQYLSRCPASLQAKNMNFDVATVSRTPSFK